MPLLTILIVLIVAGVLLWLVNNYIPMDQQNQKHFQRSCCSCCYCMASQGIREFSVSC